MCTAINNNDVFYLDLGRISYKPVLHIQGVLVKKLDDIKKDFPLDTMYRNQKSLETLINIGGVLF
jgi:hypothetical protein